MLSPALLMLLNRRTLPQLVIRIFIGLFAPIHGKHGCSGEKHFVTFSIGHFELVGGERSVDWDCVLNLFWGLLHACFSWEMTVRRYDATGVDQS